MSLFLYNLFLLLLKAGIRIAAVANPKARLWINGRKKWPDFSKGPSTIWMHCASLGEFEQGRPLLEALKEKRPDARIVLTFFSPSGYEIRKNYALADLVCYLPVDSAANASRFINMIQPELVIWVKYEYWYYYLKELNNRNIPVLLISAVFHSHHPFFKWYGGLWRKMLHCFNGIFVQNENSLKLLKQHHPDLPIVLSGDTRFDRVSAIAASFSEVPHLREFCKNKKVLVAGSTWEEDEDELIHYVNAHPEIIFIIAPHVIEKDNIIKLKKRFKKSICYSEIIAGTAPADQHLLFIDNIGMLSRLYHYADITYVGGGFGKDGIHNILEAAVYGKPVIIGPFYENFQEAADLIEAGGGFSVSHALELEQLLDALWQSPEKLKQAEKMAEEFVKQRRGATRVIMDYIQENRLLIS